MELRIDGAAVAAPKGMDRLGALIDASLRQLGTEPRVATRVWIDGGEIDGDAFDALSDRPVAGIERLEIATRAAAEVARDAAESAAEFSARVAEAIRGCAGRYRRGEIAAASEQFAEGTDALVVLLNTLRSIAVFVRPAPGAELEAQVLPALQALEARHRDEDWIAVADHLEYEIAAALERCAQTLALGPRE